LLGQLSILTLNSSFSLLEYHAIFHDLSVIEPVPYAFPDRQALYVYVYDYYKNDMQQQYYSVTRCHHPCEKAGVRLYIEAALPGQELAYI
jgi:hypothetical protein